VRSITVEESSGVWSVPVSGVGCVQLQPFVEQPFSDVPSVAVGPPGFPLPPSLPGERVEGTAVDDDLEPPIRIEGVEGIRPRGPRRPGFGRF
ncbi:hypothetical protein, partial [Streptomyces sp. SD15]